MTVSRADLFNRIIRSIHDRRLFSAGETIVIALSGGADSTALLDILANLRGIPLQLVAAHLNHSLRGEESDQDEKFAGNLAARYAVPFESRRIDVRTEASIQGLNLEDAGRRCRMSFLEEVRDRYGASAIALAHHADDQAETVLMRLLRGAGATGLGAMSWKNDLGYVRPLLDFTRAEILEHLLERSLTYREDSSNSDTVFLRNRIRHELLPHLESYNPAIKERLSATASLIADDNDLLNRLANDEYIRCASISASCITFNIQTVADIHPALLGRMIRRALSDITDTLHHFNRGHISSIISLLSDGPPNRSINLPHRLVAQREYSTIRISRPLDTKYETPVGIFIPGPGLYQLWDGMSLEVACENLPEELDKTPVDTAWFSCDAFSFPWFVRTFQPGDQIIPLGMSGTRKVKKLFMEAMIPPPQRRRIPLIFSGSELIWACGIKRSSFCRIQLPFEATSGIRSTILCT